MILLRHPDIERSLRIRNTCCPPAFSAAIRSLSASPHEVIGGRWPPVLSGTAGPKTAGATRRGDRGKGQMVTGRGPAYWEGRRRSNRRTPNTIHRVNKAIGGSTWKQHSVHVCDFEFNLGELALIDRFHSIVAGGRSRISRDHGRPLHVIADIFQPARSLPSVTRAKGGIRIWVAIAPPPPYTSSRVRRSARTALREIGGVLHDRFSIVFDRLERRSSGRGLPACAARFQCNPC